MPKRKPSASTSGKGKATTSSTGDDHRLASIIANALVQNKSALKEVAALLPAMIEPGIRPDGTEAELPEQELPEPDHAVQKQPRLGNTCTNNSDSDIDEDNLSVCSYSHGSDRLSSCQDSPDTVNEIDLGTFSSVHPVVSKKLRTKILNREFVDLGEIYFSDNLLSETTTIKKTPGATIKSVHKSAPKQISNIMTWNRAFQVYADIYASKYQSEGFQMFRYMTLIQNLANHGIAWLTYDQKFRQLRTSANLAWGSIHTETYLHCMILKPSFRLSSPQSGSSYTPKVPLHILQRRGYCWEYQKFSLCSKQICDRSHKCSNCEGFNHGASKCTKPFRRTQTADTFSKPKSNGPQNPHQRQAPSSK
jgi:hypothetical protein